MNSKSLRLSGRFELPEDLEIDDEYQFKFQGSVTSISKHSEEDGTFSFIYHIKPSTGEIMGEDGKVAKLKEKTRHSLILRRVLAQIAQDRLLDPDTFYSTTMASLEYNIMAILDFLEGLKNV